MAVEYSLHQTQSTGLAMSREMLQGLEILQLSAFDLKDYIERQLIENPALEEQGEIVFSFTPKVGVAAGNSFTERRVDPLDMVASRADTLEAILLEQLNCLRGLPKQIRFIARYIIGNLDDSGYLRMKADDIADILQVSITEAVQSLSLVRSFEPAGVAAEDLRDCLLLQLRHRPERHALAESIVTDDLDQLASGNYKVLSNKYGVSVHDIRQALEVIRSFNPRPGGFGIVEDIPYVIPDIIIRKEAGRYVITVNDKTIPRLSANTAYKQLVKDSKITDKERRFLNEHLRSAQWLLKCIEQRNATLLRIAEAISTLQTEFLDKGLSFLKPMAHKDIAEQVGLHESTVSRAVRSKYIRTPGGVFELKALFSSALQALSGESASSESVRIELQKLVSGEDRVKPYSDQQLADLLMAQGVVIARRTVAKYRKQLGIAPALQRANRR
ncbi:RNA polymerase factor sigma-54 [Paenibacillus beijingensis]|uniref:RNA polymerase factor sigma-54 n=1 Tax=Paenibacillus beijingensis TaxID=1126833 RepID=UPI000697F6CF|nr:RNA polymerase factor sigma-54 [Paenibacillus beijingensis]